MSSALGIAPPTHEPRATDYVPQMLEMIARSNARAWPTAPAGGDVNYAVRKFPGYGKLSGKSLDELRAGERVAVLDGKDDPLDFVLWKSRQAQRARRRQVERRLWPRPPGLAHRMLRHELRAFGRALRHPRRRHGPAVPAPRERDRAERRGDRQALRQLLAAQRISQCRQREDVEVARATSSRFATC
jgi:hypothetical protein